MPVLICHKWEELENGVQRAGAGWSLHMTDGDRLTYLERHLQGLPEESSITHTRPDDAPAIPITVTTDYAYGLVKKASGPGYRHFDENLLPFTTLLESVE